MLPYMPLDPNERTLLNNAVKDHGRLIDQLEYHGDRLNYETMQYLSRKPIRQGIYELVFVLCKLPVALDEILSFVTIPLTPIIELLLYLVTLGHYNEERRASIQTYRKLPLDSDGEPSLEFRREIKRLETNAHDRGLTYLLFLRDILLVKPGSTSLRILGAIVILPLVVVQQAVNFALTNVVCLPLMAFGRLLCFGLSHVLGFSLHTVNFFKMKGNEPTQDKISNSPSTILSTLGGKSPQFLEEKKQQDVTSEAPISPAKSYVTQPSSSEEPQNSVCSIM